MRNILDTKASFEDKYSIIDIFQQVKTDYPKKVAIKDVNIDITYENLDFLSDALALHITNNCSKLDEPIGILVKKSYKYLVSCIAVLKCGLPYIHIDEAYPNSTIEHILNENNVGVILSDSSFNSLSSLKSVQTINLDNLESLDEQGTYFKPIPFESADSTAIIGYTSGTTGLPKGVKVSHRAVIYSYYKFWEEVKNNEGKDRFGYITYLCWDGLSPLLNGSTGIIVPENIINSPSVLCKYIYDKNIEHCFFTPALYNSFLDELVSCNFESFPLKIVWLGGEIVSKSLICKSASTLKETILINNYGPTEFFVVSQGIIDKDISKSKREVYPYNIPTGKILSELDYLLLDDEKNDITDSGIGFLYVSGPAICNGYVNRADLNGNYFHKINGKTYFNTGDYCQVKNDRTLSLLGRDSFILTKQSITIPLKEIEDKVTDLKNIEACVVLKNITREGFTVSVYYKTNGQITKDCVEDCVADIVEFFSCKVHCFEIKDIPLHPVSKKTNYMKLKSLTY